MAEAVDALVGGEGAATTFSVRPGATGASVESLRRAKLNAVFFATEDLREQGRQKRKEAFRLSVTRRWASSDKRAPSIAFCMLYLPRHDESLQHFFLRAL